MAARRCRGARQEGRCFMNVLNLQVLGTGPVYREVILLDFENAATVARSGLLDATERLLAAEELRALAVELERGLTKPRIRSVVSYPAIAA